MQYYVLQHKPKNANQVELFAEFNRLLKTQLSNPPQAYSETSGIITMFYVVRGLSPYTEYEFHVIGVNNIGRGPASAPVSTTTGETGLIYC